ncbi:MAG: hypothetical protein NC924_02415 [Candidatus Omnitrophica bacterium]|nr:hypothetical protein [Candidatus Omnitrophota bacterium]
MIFMQGTPTTDHQKNHFYKKGLQALEKKNYAYALELFQEVLAEYPDCLECYHHLWNAARALREQEQKSGQSFIRRLRSFGLRLSAAVLMAQRKIPAAMKTLERATLLTPDSIPALHRLAIIFLQNKNPAGAQCAWEQILLLDQNNLPALKQLCRLYYDTKQYPLAKSTAQRILKITRTDLDAETILKDIAALGAIEGGFDSIKPAT